MSDLAQFRAEALALVSRRFPEREREDAFAWGVGSDEVAIFADRDPADEADELARARQWQREKFDRGFGWIQGPTEYGGGGLPEPYARAWQEIEQRFAVPNNIFFAVGHGMVGPTILAEGSDELKARYLRPLYRGDLIACQLFSEPGAGSDLASVATLAERDGDDWVVTGQKVWTSGAHYSDLALLLARTDRAAPKHRGLTTFLVDLRTPGVEVRPLRQLTGGTHFNEVFLTGVRVPDDHRLGPVNDGWRVAATTLTNERASLGPGGSLSTLGAVPFAQIVALVRQFGRDTDPEIRRAVARLYAQRRITEETARRLFDRTAGGEPPGPEVAMCKLQVTRVIGETARLVERVLGPTLVADTGQWGTYAWAQYVLGYPGTRLGGGTDEVMKNVLAERVLGLPRGTG